MKSDRSRTGDPDVRLLELLVCPQCQGALEHDEKAAVLGCGKCRLRYPIKDGIPIMLPEEAQPY